MKILQDIRFYLVVTILAFLWGSVMYSNQCLVVATQKQTIDSLKRHSDSLDMELFIETNRAGRYELGLEYLKEIDPKRYQQVDYYIGHETE